MIWCAHAHVPARNGEQGHLDFLPPARLRPPTSQTHRIGCRSCCCLFAAASMPLGVLPQAGRCQVIAGGGLSDWRDCMPVAVAAAGRHPGSLKKVACSCTDVGGGGRGGDGARGRKHTCKRSAGSLCDLPTSARSPLLRYRGDRTYRPPPPSVRARQRGLSPDHSRRQHTLWLLSESGTDPREGWGGALPQPGPPSTLQLSTSKSKGTIAGPATAVHTRPWLSRMHLPSSLSTPPPHPLSPLPSPPPPTLAISFDHWRGAARAGEAVGTLFGEQRSCEVEAIPARGWLSHLLRLQPHVERDRRPFFPPPLAGAHTNPPHHDVPRQCPPYPGHPAHHAVTTLRTPPTPPPCTGESSRRGWWRRRGWWLACGERQRGSSLLALLATRLNPLLPLPPQPPPPPTPPLLPSRLAVALARTMGRLGGWLRLATAAAVVAAVASTALGVIKDKECRENSTVRTLSGE